MTASELARTNRRLDREMYERRFADLQALRRIYLGASVTEADCRAHNAIAYRQCLANLRWLRNNFPAIAIRLPRT